MKTVALGRSFTLMSLLALMVLSGCAVAAQPDPSAASCVQSRQIIDSGTENSIDAGSLHYLLYIDVTDTSSQARDVVRDDLRQYVECAVMDDAHLTVILDPGHGTEQVPIGNLGDANISVAEARKLKRKNARGELQAKRKAIDEIMSEVDRAIADLTLAKTGSATSLLLRARNDVENIPTSDEAVLVLWSPLLGSGDNQRDCLSTEGVESTVENARAMVNRCIDVGAIRPLSVSTARVHGVGYGAATQEQQRFAGALKDALDETLFQLESEK